MVVNGGKLCLFSPLGQYHVEQFKGSLIGPWGTNSQKFVRLDTCILSFVKPTT